MNFSDFLCQWQVLATMCGVYYSTPNLAPNFSTISHLQELALLRKLVTGGSVSSVI